MTFSTNVQIYFNKPASYSHLLLNIKYCFMVKLLKINNEVALTVTDLKNKEVGIKNHRQRII